MKRSPIVRPVARSHLKAGSLVWYAPDDTPAEVLDYGNPGDLYVDENTELHVIVDVAGTNLFKHVDPKTFDRGSLGAICDVLRNNAGIAVADVFAEKAGMDS